MARYEVGCTEVIANKKRVNFLGFTLIELLVVLVLLTTLVVFAVPAYQSLVKQNRVATQINQLIAAINFARSEATRRHLVVTLCPSTNHEKCGGQWHDGWIIFTDSKALGQVDSASQILRVYRAMSVPDKLEWHGARTGNYLQMNPAGGTNGQQGTFIYCIQKNIIPQVVIVSQTGRIREDEGRDVDEKPLLCK